MVQMHAIIAGFPSPRATLDVDSALHLETGAVSFATAAAALRKAGFVLNVDTKYAYRFERGRERVDVMCSDRHAAQKQPTYHGRALFPVSGATRAMRETINVSVHADRDAEFVIPTVRGALVLKGAAVMEDSRDRGRHAEDGVMLLACLTDTHEVVPGLSATSRRRVRSLMRRLTESQRPWSSHDYVVQSLARESLEELRQPLGI